MLRFGHANKEVFEFALKLQRVGDVCVLGLSVANVCMTIIRHQDFQFVFSIWVVHQSHLGNVQAADPLCVGRGRRRRSRCLIGRVSGSAGFLGIVGFVNLVPKDLEIRLPFPIGLVNQVLFGGRSQFVRSGVERDLVVSKVGG